MSEMQLQISAALMRWKVIERALHDLSPWFMECAGVKVPATKEIGSDQITFRAEFPPMCFIEDSVPTTGLYCGEDLMRIAMMAPPENGGTIEWALALDESVASPA